MPQGRPTDAPSLVDMLPGGQRGIGSDRADIPWSAPQPVVTAQPDVAQPPADIPPPAPITNLPPPTAPPPAPEPDRPPADIPAPAPFLAPPARGRVDRATQTQNALNIIKDSTAKLTTASGQAEFNAAGVVAAKGLAAAGVPLDMARDLMTRSAYQGAEKVGYGPSAALWSLYKSSIDAGIAAAVQGYQPTAPGQVQGPYGFQPEAPVAPGKRSEAPFGGFDLRYLAKGGRVAEDEPVVVGEEGPEFFIPDQPGTVVPHMPQPGKGDEC